MNHLQDEKLLHGYLEGELEAAQRARLDGHLAECPECVQEVRELRATLSLLHSLPREDAPPGLADAVMDRIAAGEGRASRLATAFRYMAAPGAGLALAAGMAGLFVFSALGPGVLGPPGRTQPTAVDRATPGGGVAGRPTVARRERPTAAAVAPSLPTERPLGVPPVILDVSSAAAGPAVGGRSAYFSGAEPELLHSLPPKTVVLDRVDYELGRLMRDPDGFVARMLGVSEAERAHSLVRLATRATLRGNQAEIVRRLRAVDHPFAPRLAEYFERSAQMAARQRAAR